MIKRKYISINNYFHVVWIVMSQVDKSQGYIEVLA